MNFILASKSDRRKELLSRIVPDYKIIESNFDESTVKFNLSIDDYVKDIALGKAKEVSERCGLDCIIIAADTIVTIDGQILGKPIDCDHAYKMLEKLSGRWHRVYTGIVIIDNSSGNILSDVLFTDVKFSKLTNDDIVEYIKTGEPLGKAGSYAIQGIGGKFVEQIKGCYYNVVGLSINRLDRMIKSILAENKRN